ncbi:MAG: FAD-dependent oxidoreductase, partial [Erysipelotrichaceae bacterium]|nr:FAD-dependent oxidoreductase [Erysipelotrichaceae bacterium]
GDKVVVIGGGVVGIELALGLGVQEGKKVTVVEMTDTYARTANNLYKIAIDQELKKTDNITIMVSTACKEITDKGVVVSHAGEECFIEADTVIIAAGIRPKTAEAHTYYGITPYTDMAGDVVAPRLILAATYEGFCAGNRK